MKCISYDSFFGAIGSKTRLKIVEALQRKPMSVTEIGKAINEEQSKVSHNLAHLMKCRFIEVERQGKQRIYSLNKETIVPLMNLVERHIRKCCEGCTGCRK